jgi:hypothetical protein
MDQPVRPRFIVECTSSRDQDGGLVWNGRVLDLSIPGWSPVGLKGILAGDYLKLHLHLPGHQTPLSVPLATVRWIDESRCGVDPVLMDADDQLRLSRFMVQQAGSGTASTTNQEQIVITEDSFAGSIPPS